MRLRISKVKNWRRAELQELRELVNTKSNEELAQHFNVPINNIINTMTKHGISRDGSFVKELKSHKEEDNPNWKGGLSKDTARYLRIQRERHPEHKRARDAVYRALKEGKIIKPDRCQDCGRVTRDIHGHHESYEENRFLEIVWVCRKCHRKRHGNLH